MQKLSRVCKYMYLIDYEIPCKLSALHMHIYIPFYKVKFVAIVVLLASASIVLFTGYVLVVALGCDSH